MNSNLINRISFLSFLLLVVLLPIFFLPFTSIPVEASKGIFLVIGLIIAIIFWTAARFFDGEIQFPRSISLLSGAGVVIVFLLSALFSGASNVSLFGTMFDIGTFWFILAGFLLMLMSSIIFSDSKKARIVLFGTVLSSAVLILFQGLHLFFPKILALGVLFGNTDNVLGSWNALGIFAGFFIVASLFVIEFFPVTNILKWSMGALTAIAVALIAVINFVFVWEILGVFALLLFIYKMSINSNKKEEGTQIEFPIFSFAIVLISLFFFMSAGLVGGIFPAKLNIPNNEVGPSFSSTMSVTKAVLTSNPLLGIGPNRFTEAWTMYRPQAINGTQFWDVSFSSGSGLLTTFTSTTGILGILAWALFLIIFIFTGIKWLFFSIKNNISLETVSFFFLALYLIVSSFFYFTGTVIFLMAMVFAGVFIGLVASSSKGGKISIAFFDNHRKSFVFMLSLIIIIILSAAAGFRYVQRFASIPYYTKTLAATKIEDAQNNINKALALNTNDLYLRTYSQIYLLKLNAIVSKGASSLTDTDKADLQTSLTQAINGAQVAVNYNLKNYLNYQALGSVYETAGLIGVSEANDKALDAYKKASALNPYNPRLKLILMSISSALSKTKDAKDYANAALALKPDYVDALVSLSQIAKSEGDTQGAISYAEKALSFAPGNKDLINYVDSLRNGTSTSAPSVTPAPTPAPEIKTNPAPKKQ